MEIEKLDPAFTKAMLETGRIYLTGRKKQPSPTKEMKIQSVSENSGMAERWLSSLDKPFPNEFTASSTTFQHMPQAEIMEEEVGISGEVHDVPTLPIASRETDVTTDSILIVIVF